MTNKIVAIQGDNLSKIIANTDTTMFLANEAQRKGLRIFYYYPKNISSINNKIIAKGFFLKIDYKSKKLTKILSKKTLELTKCRYVLIRQDPPFNLEYISTTFLLDKVIGKTKVINNPTSIRNISEKFYSMNFVKYMVDTIFTKDIEIILKFIKKYKIAVIKPVHSYGGNDISLVGIKTKKKIIQKILNKHGHIMCQKFLKNIKYGDKRVFIINGKICGAISRVPKKGSILSNMSKGAKPKLINLTSKENKISNIVANKLKSDGVYFAGIDFIDGKLNGDINVTSPTGLKTYYDLSKINLAKTFWKGL